MFPFKVSINIKSVSRLCVHMPWTHINNSLKKQMSLEQFSDSSWWFSQIEMNGLKLRIAKNRNFPCALRVKNPNLNPRECPLKDIVKVSLWSPLFYSWMIWWCHPYATLLIAILYNPYCCYENNYPNQMFCVNPGLYFLSLSEEACWSATTHPTITMNDLKPYWDQTPCSLTLSKYLLAQIANLHMLVVWVLMFCFGW